MPAKQTGRRSRTLAGIQTPPDVWRRVRRVILGAPRDLSDSSLFHRISLVALLAWVGLGADGLSSSAYGPEEAFRALGGHTYLAVGLALATACTVFVIAIAYSRVIEHFPYGGGGYIVASHLLGPRAGALSGSALLIDYVLTVSVSIASCADQLFCVLPGWALPYKLGAEAMIIGLMVAMNLRGVKESILVLTPIFVLFIITHAVLIFGGVASHLSEAPRVARDMAAGFRDGYATLGLGGMLILFLRAYSMGAGTFTGIEAVSNGLQMMREPKVATGKRAMLYMSVSLAITAAGILICYLLFRVEPEPGETMNAALLGRFAGDWRWGTLPVGRGFVTLALAAEAALLFVAAQAGFTDGPRVMANMAVDGWLPRRLSQLSDRLTLQTGVLLMGGAAMVALLYARGNITTLVTMYSINVFITFSLTELGMTKFWIRERRRRANWKSQLPVHLIGLTLCATILVVVIIEKFDQGAWLTLLSTAALVAACFLIHRHYGGVARAIRSFDPALRDLETEPPQTPPVFDPAERTAAALVSVYGGLGAYQLLQLRRLFPGQFRNLVFISVGVVDSATMAGAEEVDRTRQRVEVALGQYAALAQRLGWAARVQMGLGIDAVEESVRLCREVARECPRTVFFMGKLIFSRERWYHRFLHNETAYQIQRRLHAEGLDAVVLPANLAAWSGMAKL